MGSMYVPKWGFINGWRQGPFLFLKAGLRSGNGWLPRGKGDQQAARRKIKNKFKKRFLQVLVSLRSSPKLSHVIGAYWGSQGSPLAVHDFINQRI